MLLIISCKKEFNQPDFHKVQELSEKHQILVNKVRQTSYIVSEVFKDKDIRTMFGEAVRDKISSPNTEEAITLLELFDVSADAPYRELATRFSEKFLDIYYSGNYMYSSKFPKPDPRKKNQNRNYRTGNYSFDPYDPDILNFEDGRKIYFPYSENFDLETASEVTFSYTPVTQEDENEGYKLELGESGVTIDQFPCDTSTEGGMYCEYDYVYVSQVNDDYCWREPTLIVNFNEPPSEIFELDSVPPPPISCQYLTYNTTSAALNQSYVVTTTIPHWRLTKHYRGVFGGASVILLYRISTQLGTLSQNPYGYYNPSIDGPFLLLGERTVKRKDIRKDGGKWQSNSSILWDEDWDMHEAEQKILLVSKQGFLSHPPILELEAGLNIGLDSSGNISASIFRNLSTTIDFNKRYKNRYYNTLPRTGIFANVIGDLGNGTAKTFGLDLYDFPIRTADGFEYYFKHNICY